MKKHDPWLGGGKLPTDKPNPIWVAKHYLNLVNRPPRLVERNSGYFMDGIPVTLTSIMRETNRLRLSDGKSQLGANPEWVIPEVIPFPPVPSASAAYRG